MQSPTYAQEKTEFFQDLKTRYFIVKDILAKRKHGFSLKALPFNSGYFMSFLLEKGSAEKLRQELLQKEGIGTISIQDKYLRVAFSSVDAKDLPALYDTIFTVADRLADQTR